MNPKITRREFITAANTLPFFSHALKAVDAGAIKKTGANSQPLVLWYEKPASQ